MKELADIIASSEDWLMERVLRYAKERGYVKYTSTLAEAWRVSIAGLSAALLDGIARYDSAPEIGPDEDYTLDPLASFGILEARMHRKRGVTLSMFLGLMKYYRQSYLDLVAEGRFTQEQGETYRHFIRRFFDRVELGFCTEWGEWAARAHDAKMEELQQATRAMTNEKNKYLTIFESVQDPVMFLDRHDRIENMNHAAARVLAGAKVPGSLYYGDGQPGEGIPWLREELAALASSDSGEKTCDKSVETTEGPRQYHVRIKRMLDVSEKFLGTVVILSDVTQRRLAEEERERVIVQLQDALARVKTLGGLIPICSSCKKIRDDKGYWDHVESYLREHSNAEFSHGLCPACTTTLYPDFCRRTT